MNWPTIIIGAVAFVLASILLIYLLFRRREYKLPHPIDGKVTKDQAPGLTRNERRRYAKLYKKALEKQNAGKG